jgi:hypothetical protein
MRCRSADVIFSGTALISSRVEGAGESVGAVSAGVSVSIGDGDSAGDGEGAGVADGFREGDGEANNQFNKLAVGDETLSRLVLGAPKA